MELQVIKQRIYTIRGQRVMLDFDLAELYEVETKALNQAMKRNMSRFPDEFVFRLSEEEWVQMRSQSVTASQKKRNKGITPYAFTEYGIAMLASILKSDRAIYMNIAIVRAFIALKQIALKQGKLSEQIQELRSLLEQRIDEHDVQLKSIYNTLEDLLDKKIDEEVRQVAWENRERIGFKP